MVKIKLCDRNITFGNNPRRLWICGSTQILMSSCRMWTSRLSLIPFPPPPSPKNVLHTVDVKLSISTLYQGSSSISQATPSSVRNFIAATFDNVIQWYINTVFNSDNENKAICKAYTSLGNELLDKLKLFRHYSLQSLVCLSINNCTHREKLTLIGPVVSLLYHHKSLEQVYHNNATYTCDVRWKDLSSCAVRIQTDSDVHWNVRPGFKDQSMRHLIKFM